MTKSPIVLVTAAVAFCLIAIAFFIYHSSGPVEPEKVSITLAEDGSITAVTSILPQEYFVEQIGKDRVEVQALVTPGSSPATYEPTPRQMAALSRAELFFRIGAPFENALVPKIESTKGLRIIDTREGITLRGNDPHIWLSPRLVKVQARTIANALIDIDPAGRDNYKKHLAVFLGELDALDARLANALAPVRGRSFMVFHPSWGYFANDYGLNQQAIELEGKEPSGRQLVRMVNMAKAQDVHAIFVQPQFDMDSAQRIADAIDGVVVPIDPLARDYIANLEQVASTLLKALQEQK